MELAKQTAIARGWLALGEWNSFYRREKARPDERLRRMRDGGGLVMFFVTADGATFAKAHASSANADCGVSFHGGIGAGRRHRETPLDLAQFAAPAGSPGSSGPVLGGNPAPVLPSIQGDEDTLFPIQPWWLMWTQPYRWIGKITTVDIGTGVGGQDQWQGTGALIGPRHVVTAGHVSYNWPKWAPEGQWLHFDGYKPAFMPGQFKTGVQPNGAGRQIIGAWAEYDWVINRNRDGDLGYLLLFDEERTAWLGHFPGFCSASADYLEGKTLTMHGYPASKWYYAPWTDLPTCENSPSQLDCGGYMYRDINGCRISEVTSKRFFYDCDTLPGMSGAPVWAYHPDNGLPCIFGVHHTGDIGENGAARMTKSRASAGLLEVVCAFPSMFGAHWGCP